MRRVLLSINAENFFVPMWVNLYLENGFGVDLISRYNLRNNRYYDRLKTSQQFKSSSLRFLLSKNRFLRTKPIDYTKMLVQSYVTSQMFEYSALHIHSLEIRGLAALVSKVKKIILSPYGSDIFDDAKWGPIPKSIPDHFIRRVIARGDLILPTSKFMEQRIVSHFGADPSRVFTKSWGIDLSYWDKCIPKPPPQISKTKLDENTVIFLSFRSAKPAYRIHLLPYVQKVLERQGIDTLFIYCFNLTERTEYADNIINTIRRLSLSDKSIIFYNPIRSETLKALLQLSHFFFSIPRWDQISSSLLEGMYMGSFPVISSLPAYSELIEQGCRAVMTSATIKSIAESLIDAIQNELYTSQDILSRNRSTVTRYHNRERNLQEIKNKILEAIGL